MNVITQNDILFTQTKHITLLRFDLHFFLKSNTLTQSLAIVIERKNV